MDPRHHHCHATTLVNDDEEQHGREESMSLLANIPQRHLDHSSINSSAAEEENSAHFVPTASVNEKGKQVKTCDQAIDELGFGPFQLLLLIVLGVCWGCDAMEVMLLTFVAPELKKKWNLSDTEQATLNAVIFVGMLFGASFFGWVADRYGRKVGVASCLIVTTVFGLLSAVSYNIWMLGICQVLVGFGVAGSTVPFSLFTEFLPSSKRGHFLIIIEVFWTFGVMLEASLAWIILPEDPVRLKLFHGMGWRFLIGFSTLPMLFALLCVPLLPESPRYLVMHGRTEECKKIFKKMAWLNGRGEFTAEIADQSINSNAIQGVSSLETTDQESEKTVPTTSKTSFKFMELFSRHLFVTTILTMLLWFIGAFGYYGVIIMTPVYFEKLIGNSGGNELYLETFVVSCAELPGLLWATAIINLLGRKKTQSILFMSTGLCLILLALPSDPNNTWLMTIFAFGARASIMGATCATWTYTPEVYPTSCRTLAMGMCSSVGRLGGIVTPYIASILIRIYPSLPVGIYAGSCLIAAVVALLLPIETMGRKLVDHIPHVKTQTKKANGVQVGVDN